jgi:prepilin-type N-terminal cleavage/methylation domain-containing protein
MRRRRGLTIIEVLVALAIIAVAFTLLSTALVGSLQQTSRAGTRTQTTQYLEFLGRQVAGGSGAVLAAAGTPIAWAYGALDDAFPELPGAGGADAAAYRAEVAQVATVAFAGASAVQYRITVCTQDATGETCVAGTTLGPPPSAGGTPPLLPGIN